MMSTGLELAIAGYLAWKMGVAGKDFWDHADDARPLVNISAGLALVGIMMFFAGVLTTIAHAGWALAAWYGGS